MRRKNIYFILCLILFCSFLHPVEATSFYQSSAEAALSGQIFIPFSSVAHITYFDDGSERIEMQPVTISIARGERSFYKDSYYRDSSGTVLWKATLEGTFSFNGVSASCTAASCTTTSYSSAWSEQSTTAYPSGASAIGSATMVRKFLFIVVDTVSVNISMVCDKDGSVS